MTVGDEILIGVRRELDWAREGPTTPGEKHFSWATLEAWDFFDDLPLLASGSLAVLIEGEIYLDADVPRVTQPEQIRARNPRYLFIRVVEKETRVRRSIGLFRTDAAPTFAELKSVAYLGGENNRSSRNGAAIAATVVSSDSPRSAHRSE